jgi:SpoVK/Ycf46/Vps4 family AAA+-type ATPase
MENNKKNLIKEANELAELHLFKKDVIQKILDDLDKLKSLTKEHVEGMAIVQELLEEMDELEKKHQEIQNKIRN